MVRLPEVKRTEEEFTKAAKKNDALADGSKMNQDEFRKIMKKLEDKYKISENSSWAEKIRYNIRNICYLTNQEILDLRDEVREFVASGPSEEDLMMLQGPCESLSMICSAIELGALEGRQPVKKLEGEEKEAYYREKTMISDAAKAEEAELFEQMLKDKNGNLIWDSESRKIHDEMIRNFMNSLKDLKRKYGIERDNEKIT